MNMISYFVKKSFNEDLRKVDSLPEGHSWVYGSEVTNLELEKVAEEAKLDMNILRDVRDVYELPRVEFSKGAAYVFVRIPRSIKGLTASSAPLLFVVRGDMLATFSSIKYFTPDELAKQYRFSMRSSTSVFLQVLSHIFTQYGKDIHKVSSQIEDAQKRLQSRKLTDKDFTKFVNLESMLAEYSTNLVASRAVLDRLFENKHDLLTEKEKEFLDDVILYVNQLTVAVQSNSQTIISIRDTFSIMSDNALNHRMKTLTLLTMFLTVPNVIFGMFGMNVVLPVNDRDPWMFGAILLASVLLIFLGYVVVRKYKV